MYKSVTSKNTMHETSFEVGYITVSIESKVAIDDHFTAVLKRNGWKVQYRENDMFFCQATEYNICSGASLLEAISELKKLVKNKFYPDEGDRISIIIAESRHINYFSDDHFYRDDMLILSDFHQILDDISWNGGLQEPNAPLRRKNVIKIKSPQPKKNDETSRLG